MFDLASSTSVAWAGPGLDPLVVVVDGDRQDLLGVLLADDVVVQEVEDLTGLGQLLERELRGLGELLGDDVVAEVDALVADVDAGAGDQLLDLLLGLAAEAALHEVPAVPELRHRLPLRPCTSLRRADGFGGTYGITGRDHLVDQAVGHRLVGGDHEVPIGVSGDLVRRPGRCRRRSSN